MRPSPGTSINGSFTRRPRPDPDSDGTAQAHRLREASMAVSVEPALDYRDFVHTGPGTLAGRYMRTFWQPVGVSDQLAPGAAKPVRILGEDFTLYRGEAPAGAPPLPNPPPPG